MDFSKLVECKVTIGISDPWDFEKEVGVSHLSGMIKAVYITTHIRKDFEYATESLLINLLKPFGYKKLKTEYFIASPRHSGNGLIELAQGKGVPFNFIRVSSQRAKSDSTFDYNHWKAEKSFAFVGGLAIEVGCSESA
jgi:hypothetical protein